MAIAVAAGGADLRTVQKVLVGGPGAVKGGVGERVAEAAKRLGVPVAETASPVLPPSIPPPDHAP